MKLVRIAETIGANYASLRNWKRRGYISGEVDYSDDSAVRVAIFFSLVRCGIIASMAAKWTAMVSPRARKPVRIPQISKEGYQTGYIWVDVPKHRRVLGV